MSFLNRKTIGKYQLLHFFEHLCSSSFGNLKKKCIFRKRRMHLLCFFFHKIQLLSVSFFNKTFLTLLSVLALGC